METTHGELQTHHNKAIRDDPTYRMEGLLDARMEEMMANIPTFEEPTEVATLQEPWTASQWDMVVQLRCEIAYLNRKIAKLDKAIKERTSKKGRYKDYG